MKTCDIDMSGAIAVDEFVAWFTKSPMFKKQRKKFVSHATKESKLLAAKEEMAHTLHSLPSSIRWVAAPPAGGHAPPIAQVLP